MPKRTSVVFVAAAANIVNVSRYVWFIQICETSCVVNETYANSEAALAHTKGVALQEILPKILRVAKMTKIDVYGNPSEELQKVLTGDAQIYNFFVGFSR